MHKGQWSTPELHCALLNQEALLSTKIFVLILFHDHFPQAQSFLHRTASNNENYTGYPDFSPNVLCNIVSANHATQRSVCQMQGIPLNTATVNSLPIFYKTPAPSSKLFRVLHHLHQHLRILGHSQTCYLHIAPQHRHQSYQRITPQYSHQSYNNLTHNQSCVTYE